VSTELVRLTIVPNEIEAEQVRALLSFEGVPSMQRITDPGYGLADETSPAGPREILVRAEDLENARALIADG
jgi:Putative prokaryotic signal transducing protein